jgi:D-threo-aldose 1-dehydrogenase
MQRTFARSGLKTSLLGFGSAPLGNLFRTITTADSHEMVRAAWDAGIRLYDTAPMYGHGLAEHRMSDALFEYPRDEYVLATKVGRTLTPAAPGSFDHGAWAKVPPLAATFDYSYEACFQQVNDSLQRMMSDRADVLFVHDIDRYTHGDNQPTRFKEAIKGSFKALIEMRDAGKVKEIGVGVNEADVCFQVAQEVDIDSILLAGRYTLLEQDPLDDLLPLCTERKISIILGGVLNSGILATGAVKGAKYNYSEAPVEILEKVAKIQAVCTEFNIPLAAAAIQFASAHPAVVNVCVGARNMKQWNENFALLNHQIPADFWNRLKKKGLVRDDAPVPTEAPGKGWNPSSGFMFS